MCEKRWVFRTDLNVAKDCIFLISIGKEFQSTGADAEKARLPYVCVLTGRTERRFCEDDRSGRAGMWWWIRSVMYEGERLFSALKHIMRILNITRFSTGNQWRSWRIGEIESLERAPDISLAAVFWILWTRYMSFFGRPYKRTLQLSTWDIINEWTKVSIDFLFRYCRICPILRMAMTADRQVLVIWSDIERCMSMMTPRLRTLVTAGTFTPSTLTTRGCDK